jgi:hypothetical protein
MRTNFRESTPVTYLQVSEEGGKGSGFVFSRHAETGLGCMLDMVGEGDWFLAFEVVESSRYRLECRV